MANIPFLNNAYFSADVGIGTDSPNSKLEVTESITFSSIDTFGQFVIKAASGSTGDLLNLGVDTTNSVAFIQAVERGINSIPLSLQRYGGNVGIGTDSPVSASSGSGLDVSGMAVVRGPLASHQTNAGVFERSGDIISLRAYGSSGNGALSFKTGGGGGTADSEKMGISSTGTVYLNAYDSTNKTGTPTYLLGTDASGNLVKTNTIPGSGTGPYLPLTAGSGEALTGDLYLGGFNKISGVTSDNLVIGVDINNVSGGSSIDFQVDGATSALLINNSRNAIFSGKILAGLGTSASATINAYSATVAANLFSALRVMDNTSASSYWDVGATGGSSTLLNFYHNSNTSPKVSFTNAGIIDIAGGEIRLASQTTTRLQLVTNQATIYAGGLQVFTGANAVQDGVVIGNTTGDIDITLAGGANNKVLFLRGSDGNVGIGNTNPTLGKLQVSGIIFIDRNGTNGTSANPYFEDALSLGASSNRSKIQFGNSFGSDNGTFLKFTVNSTTAPNTNIDALTITPFGNVGIGTTSPDLKLHVTNTQNTDPTIFQLRLEGNSGNWFDLGRKVSTGAFIIQGNQTGANNIGLAPTSGNVGIGTDSPTSYGATYKNLDVVGTNGAYLTLKGTTNVVTVDFAAETTAGYIGTKTAHPFVFRTSDVTALTLDSSQNATFVGNLKGTTAAFSGQVNINDTGTTSGRGWEIFNSSTTSNWIQSYDRISSAWMDVRIRAKSFQFDAESASSAYTIDTSGNNTWSGTAAFGGSGDSYFTGNLGIGVTGPSYKLDTSGSDGVQARFTSDSVATGYAPASILLEANNASKRGQGIYNYNTLADENWFTGVPYNVNSKKWIVANQYNTSFDVSTAQLTYALLTIDSDTGNVGIGTSTPDAKLQVGLGTSNAQSTVAALSGSSATILNALSLVNDSGGQTGGGVTIDFHNNSTWSATGRISVLQTGGTAAAMTFSTYSSSIQERMRIDSVGNVGIGTTSPDNILHVRKGDTGYASQVGADTMLILETTNVSNSLQFSSTTAGNQYIMFGDNDPNAGWIAYSHSADSMHFRLGGLEKMVISSSGIVNIANLAGSGNRIVYANSTGDLGDMVIGSGLAFDGTTLTATGGSSGTISGSGTAGFLTKFTGASSVGNSSLSETGTTVSTSLAFAATTAGFSGSNDSFFTGSLGVGIVGPLVKLDVVDNSQTASIRTRHSSLSQGISIGYNTITANGTNANQDIFITSKGTGAVLVTGGQVGIGTTTPVGQLCLNNQISNGASPVSSYPTTNPGTTNNQSFFNSYYASGSDGLGPWPRYFDIVCNGSPDGTNGGSNIRFLTNHVNVGSASIERMRVTSNGDVGIGQPAPSYKLDVSGTIRATSVIYGNSYFEGNAANARVKYGVWAEQTYGMGMGAGYSYGGLNNYATTFQMDNTSTRGWWWGDTTHTNAQGAMSLTTEGKLTVANYTRIGYGESDTTTPATYILDANGTIRATGDVIAYSDARVKDNVNTIENA